MVAECRAVRICRSARPVLLSSLATPQSQLHPAPHEQPDPTPDPPPPAGVARPGHRARGADAVRPPGPGPVPPPDPAARLAIDVVELTATQVHDDLLASRYTVTELVQAFLDRIARYEDHYNAFISMNPEALAVAAALD